MNNDFINKISNLTLLGYYDESKDLIVVHFFNKDEDKPDIVAFLKRNMDWDVREIISEKATLFPDKEIIEIQYKQIEIFKQNSKFDKFVRSSLEKTAEQNKQIKMFEILKMGKYYD